MMMRKGSAGQFSNLRMVEMVCSKGSRDLFQPDARLQLCS